MADDVLERTLQVLVAERLVDDKRMQRQAHHARAAGAFLVQHVELVHDHLREVRPAEALADEQTDVVHLD